MKHLRMGTRGSRLALEQSEIVARRLRSAGVTVDLVPIVSDGDLRGPDTPIGEGVFVTALERALAGGEIDLAVHSAKDLPLEEDPRLTIAAYPERADPRDVLVTRSGVDSVAGLPAHAKVGTDSPRRAGFLLAMRPDLDVVPLHGNVDTRLRRLESGQADALVLAAAGLDRLGLGARAVARLDPESMPPAPGQGALAVQARRGDAEVASVLAPLDDARVRKAVVAERALLMAMGGGCRSPVGAVALRNGEGLVLVAGAVTPDGRTRHVLRRALGGDAASSATTVCLAAGELNRRVPLDSRVLLDTRPELDRGLAEAVRAMGFRHVHVPTIAIRAAAAGGELDRVQTHLAEYDWIVLTSRRGVEALLDGATASPAHGTRWAAVGPSTAEALAAHGVHADCVPAQGTADAIPSAMAEHGSLAGARVLLARADAAGSALPDQLRRMGAEVDDVVAYRTAEAPAGSRGALPDVLADPHLEAVVFASGSAARGLVQLCGGDVEHVRHLRVITIGPRTSAVVRELGLAVAGEAATRDSAGLASALKSALDHEVERWFESQLRLPV